MAFMVSCGVSLIDLELILRGRPRFFLTTFEVVGSEETKFGISIREDSGNGETSMTALVATSVTTSVAVLVATSVKTLTVISETESFTINCSFSLSEYSCS